MYWADKLTKSLDVNKKHRVDDMKTPSGHAHAGSLRAIATHGLTYEAMKKAGLDVEFTYVVNNMDPMDGLPRYLDPEIYEQHMGKPLFQIPAPDGESENFAAQYANEYIGAFNHLGFKPRIIWSREIYKEGLIDPYIKLALDHVEKIRKIYKQVTNQNKPEGWYPFQVICPNCGKVGSNLVTDWDGETVAYECKPDLVKWAKGCGHSGRISPFGGTGKLMWKVDWCAHWAALNITVEGAGKDHFSEGGSRYISAAVMEEVFEKEPPFGFLHEFLLIGGAKMSSSKGNATTAAEFSQILPVEVGRFLFVRTPYQRAINFDPQQSDTIPDLFDEYDRCALEFFESGLKTDYGRYYEAAQLEAPAPEEKLFLPRFRQVATFIQMPSVDLVAYFEEEKGTKLNDKEITILEERVEFAKLWLDRFADEKEKFEIKQEIPELAIGLDQQSKQFLKELAEMIEQESITDPNQLQQKIYDLAKATIGSKQGFSAIYAALLDKKFGPRAGWLILEQEKSNPGFVLERFKQIAADNFQAIQTTNRFPTISIPEKLSISTEVKQKWPSIVVAYAEIEGVKIVKQLPELEELKKQELEKLAQLTRDDINNMNAIQSYRKLYKETGIDWHSRRPSPEALLRRLTQGKDLYTVNTCVDAYNLVVMNHRVSIGAFDLDKVQFPTILKLAEGGEQISLLGDTDATEIKTGELCYIDNQGPYNLDFNYRDADRTKVTLDTKNLLINVEGVYDISRDEVELSLQEAIELITRFCGGTVRTIGIIE